MPIDTREAARLAIARTSARPRPPTPEFIAGELTKCTASFEYFTDHYCYIYDNDTESWIASSCGPNSANWLR